MEVVMQPGDRLEITFAVGPDELPRGVIVEFHDNEEEVTVYCDGLGPSDSGECPSIRVRDADQG